MSDINKIHELEDAEIERRIGKGLQQFGLFALALLGFGVLFAGAIAVMKIHFMIGAVFAIVVLIGAVIVVGVVVERNSKKKKNKIINPEAGE